MSYNFAFQVNPNIFQYYPRLYRLRNYVDLHFCEPLSLETAARVAGLEKTYFSKFFHEKAGICFRDWLTQKRIEHAISLMKHGKSSITDVAFASGFQDLRTFERCFRKFTGVCPRVMRKQLQA